MHKQIIATLGLSFLVVRVLVHHFKRVRRFGVYFSSSRWILSQLNSSNSVPDLSCRTKVTLSEHSNAISFCTILPISFTTFCRMRLWLRHCLAVPLCCRRASCLHSFRQDGVIVKFFGLLGYETVTYT